MEHAEIRVRVDVRQWQRFVTLCERDETAPGDVLRNLLRLEVQRRTRSAARRNAVHDERLLVRLRLLVARALAEARDWPSLQVAMARHCLAFRAHGGGLAVADLGTGDILCKGSDVGPGYASLIRRFRAPFPDHPQVGLAARVLAAC